MLVYVLGVLENSKHALPFQLQISDKGVVIVRQVTGIAIDRYGDYKDEEETDVKK